MRRLLALLLVAIGLVALVACGSNDDGNGVDSGAARADQTDDTLPDDTLPDDTLPDDTLPDDTEVDQVEDQAPEGIEGVEAYAIEDNSHVEGSIDYDQSPPVGGPHNPVWVNCGFYSSEVPNENAVHALEHGAVWITYDDVGDDTLERLAEFADDDGHVLVSGYPDQDTPLVLTAWNRQLAVEGVDDPRVEAFLDTYVGADSAPEPGAACTGGVG